jgi:hypothetical protein
MVSLETVMAKRVPISFNKPEFEKLKEASKLSGSSFSEFVKKLVSKALGDGVYDKLILISNMYGSVKEKDKVVTSVYLDDDMYNELYELSMKYNIALSTLIRSLSLYGFDYNKDDVRIKVPKTNGLWVKFDFAELTAYIECKNGHRLLELAVGQDMYEIAKTLSKIKVRCPVCGSSNMYIHIVVSGKRKVVVNAQA